MSDQHPVERSIKTTFTGVFVNLALALIKGVAGFFGNSYALIADAVESVSDVFTSFVVFLGLKVSTLKPNKNFPYGHGKAEPIAGALVSIVLIIAAVFIAVTGIDNIRTPHASPEPFTLFVLLLVIVVKEVLFRYALKIGEQTESTAIKAEAWHHRSDAITSAAAFIGIFIAVVGGPGYESADDWAALVASAFIVYNSYTLLKPAVKEIMDAAPPEELLYEVREIALAVTGVLGIDKVFIRKMGFDYYVDMHVVVDGDISVKTGHDIAHLVKDEILKQKPRISNVFVHIEPYDPEYDS